MTPALEHEGGRRIQRDSESYQALLDWIARGAPYGAADLTVTRLTAAPADEAGHRDDRDSRPVQLAGAEAARGVLAFAASGGSEGEGLASPGDILSIRASTLG